MQRQSLSKGERNGKEWGEKALAFSEVGHFHFILSVHFIAFIVNKIHLQAIGMLILTQKTENLSGYDQDWIKLR